MKTLIQMICILGIIILGVVLVINFVDVKPKDEYKEFQHNTKIIKGNVIETKENRRFLLPTEYNLVVDTGKNNTKLLKVDKKQYINYQKGSEVNFRIDTTSNNEVIIDLNKSKDIKSKKDYENRNKNDGLFGKVIDS